MITAYTMEAKILKFSKWLKASMDSAGLSQTQLAAKSGVSKQHINGLLAADPGRMSSILASAASAATDDKTALKRRAKQIEKQIAKNREAQSKLIARFADVEDSLSELIEKQVRALDVETKRLTAELQEVMARLSLSAKQKLQASALIELASHSCESGTIEAERQRLDALGLRVFTDGRTDWRIEFAVAMPEIETGHPALNLTLFEAERPDCPDGRISRVRAT